MVRGDRRGHELGFPTANIPVPPVWRCPPMVLRRLGHAAGQSFTACWHHLRRHKSTFDGMERRVEAYVLDRDDLELYDVEIAIDFYARLRGR